MSPDDHHAAEVGSRLQRVINATGVVLHADLGRAPLSAAARAALAEAAGYTTAELDLATRGRAARTTHLGAQLAAVCGTEAAAVVNNGAGAVLLALAALGGGREVVVSRGELVELDGYRVTDTAEAATARLVEVGATNRTRLDDYRAAIGTATALLLKVHRAGATLAGSTEEVDPAMLAQLGHETGLPVVHVVGSGLLVEVASGPLAAEPSVAAAVRAGIDLVVFPADELLGGPQAGVLAGRADLVLRLRRHPLARALELDKLRIAALEATLDAHARSAVPVDVPTVAMLSTETSMLRRRAEWIAQQLGGDAQAVAVAAPVGAGVLAGVELPSWAVEVARADGERLVERLRRGRPPVIARDDDGLVLLDLRTVPPSQDLELVDLVRAALG